MATVRHVQGRHPDLTDTGDLRADAYLPPAEREMGRTMRDDARREHLLHQAALEQREYPTLVQQYIQGRTFAPGRSPAEGYREYVGERDWALQQWGRNQGYDVTVTDADVSRMDLQTFDRYFDERGQPRTGVLLWRTSRSQVLDDGTNMRPSR